MFSWSFPVCHSNQTTCRIQIPQNSNSLQIIKADLFRDGVGERARETDTGIFSVLPGTELSQTCGCRKQQEWLRKESVKKGAALGAQGERGEIFRVTLDA